MLYLIVSMYGGLCEYLYSIVYHFLVMTLEYWENNYNNETREIKPKIKSPNSYIYILLDINSN